jgi:nucleoside-diphosphate-sugar epimerase
MASLFLVTGGNGFVGRQIIKALNVKGYKIRAVIRRGGRNAPHLKSTNVTTIESNDVFQENESWWREALSGVDYVIHAAWYVNPMDYLTSKKNIDSLISTLTIAKISAELNVKKFVGIGTCFEYKQSNQDLSFRSPLEPVTLYASTKVAAYNVLIHLFENTKTNFLWCRLFYLYGEGEKKERLVPYIVRNLIANKNVELTSAEEIKDYMDVEDAAREIVKATISKRTGPINICTGIGISVYDLAISLAKKVNKSHLIKIGKKDKKNTNPKRVVGIKN